MIPPELLKDIIYLSRLYYAGSGSMRQRIRKYKFI